MVGLPRPGADVPGRHALGLIHALIGQVEIACELGHLITGVASPRHDRHKGIGDHPGLVSVLHLAGCHERRLIVVAQIAELACGLQEALGCPHSIGIVDPEVEPIGGKRLPQSLKPRSIIVPASSLDMRVERMPSFLAS